MSALDDRHWLTLGPRGSTILCGQCDDVGHPVQIREVYVGPNVLHGIGCCINCGRDTILWEREAILCHG